MIRREYLQTDLGGFCFGDVGKERSDLNQQLVDVIDAPGNALYQTICRSGARKYKK
jgi:hypothetical protein